ncbi:MAG: DUF3168 domain-containing protein [Rickettsiales bacterium]
MSIDYHIIQKAIYEKLSGNSQILSLVNGIFDVPPQDADFPFITIGGSQVNILDKLSGGNVEYIFEINVWSRKSGRKELVDIMDLIYDEFHNNIINISGKEILSARIVSHDINMENDGYTYNGALRIRILLKV